MLGYKLFQAGFDTLALAAVVLDVGTAISAAGTTQTTATQLTNSVNDIGTVAAGAGVVLWTGTAGDSQIVYNRGANAVSVYPPNGARINSLPINSPHVLAPSTACEYWFSSTTTVIGILSA